MFCVRFVDLAGLELKSIFEMKNLTNFVSFSLQTHLLNNSDRHQLVQQMQLIGGGAHGPQAAAAIRHVAAQNGVWSLGNFGGVPPKSAMSFYDPSNKNTVAATNADVQQQQQQPTAQDTMCPFDQNVTVEPSEYRFVFNSCGAGMAIASMGGAFIDCNKLFCQLSNYSKQEICSLTIFNLTARQDLQQAFDKVSQLISPPMNESGICSSEKPKPVVFRGAMKNRDDLGLSVSIVKGSDGVAKCFCVTLVKNRDGPFDVSKPVPVSFDSVAPQLIMTKVQNDMASAPAFTSG
jgi:PAS domain-containing protein